MTWTLFSNRAFFALKASTSLMIGSSLSTLDLGLGDLLLLLVDLVPQVQEMTECQGDAEEPHDEQCQVTQSALALGAGDPGSPCRARGNGFPGLSYEIDTDHGRLIPQPPQSQAQPPPRGSARSTSATARRSCSR